MPNEPFPPSLFGQKTLSVRVGIILLVACFTGCTILIWFFHVSNQHTRETITFGSTLIGSCLAIATIAGTAENLRRGIHEKRSLAAARFIERWNDPSSLIIKTAWRALLTDLKKLEGDAAARRISENEADRVVATEVLNFFEEMGVAINTGAADQELLKRVFGTVMTTYFAAAEPWVKWLRKDRNNYAYFVEIEYVVQRWRSSASLS